MNRYCFCESPLRKRKRYPRDDCINCCRPQSDTAQYIFECINEQCLYWKISTQPYNVCEDCLAVMLIKTTLSKSIDENGLNQQNFTNIFCTAPFDLRF